MSLTKKGSEFEKRIKPNPSEIGTKKPIRIPSMGTGKGQKSEHRPK